MDGSNGTADSIMGEGLMTMLVKFLDLMLQLVQKENSEIKYQTNASN